MQRGILTISAGQLLNPMNKTNVPRDIDALIDTARECLGMAGRQSRRCSARLWSDRYIDSQAPLLRRLAIHTLSFRTDLSADDKIAWLLERCDIHETAARHEIFRAARIAYPQTGRELRKALIAAITKFQWPREDEPDKEHREAYHRYTWYHWLHTADPQCEVAKQKSALDEVLAGYSDFQPSEHPDFTFWAGIWTEG